MTSELLRIFLFFIVILGKLSKVSYSKPFEKVPGYLKSGFITTPHLSLLLILFLTVAWTIEIKEDAFSDWSWESGIGLPASNFPIPPGGLKSKLSRRESFFSSGRLKSFFRWYKQNARNPEFFLYKMFFLDEGLPIINNPADAKTIIKMNSVVVASPIFGPFYQGY